MITVGEIKEYARSLGVPVSGVCSAEDDETLLSVLKKRRENFSVSDFEEQDIVKRCSLKMLMPKARSVFVCMFPYYIQDVRPNNLSCYAAIPDYHLVAGEILQKIADYIKQYRPDVHCRPLCDVGVQVDRWLGYRAGLGFFGKNNLLIHPEFGSYFFIGSLLLDLELEPDLPIGEGCQGCGECLSACPGGALTEEFGFDCNRCISYLTQKKTLSESEQALVMAQSSVYGCDVCQQVCPHNQQVPETPIEAFRQGILTGLNQEELSGMSNRAFKKAYASYAFSWCSKQTILKNFHK